MNSIRIDVQRGSTRHGSCAGFSLIELVVVVAILGILAAIAVPAYVGLQNGAKDAAVQADLLNAKKSLVAFGVDHDGGLPTTVARNGAGTYGSTAVDLTRYGWTSGPSTTDLAFARNGVSWCVLATSTTGANFAVTPRSAVVRSATCPG